MMNTQHEHDDHAGDHHGNGEQDIGHQHRGGEDHQPGDDDHGGKQLDNHEILKLKIEVQLDRYESVHDDEEGKSPLVLFVSGPIHFIIWRTLESRKRMIGLISEIQLMSILNKMSFVAYCVR